MVLINDYYCGRCNSKVKEMASICPNCQNHLSGHIITKSTIITEDRFKFLENAYQDNFFYIKEMTKDEKEKYLKHNLQKDLPIWLCVLLHLLTFGIFTLIYFGLKHGKLPKINEDDPSTGKAIGYMFIPLYNIYWGYFFWVRLVDRINFQYKIRKKETPIDRTYVEVAAIVGLIPYINLISFLFLKTIAISQIQDASNELSSKND